MARYFRTLLLSLIITGTLFLASASAAPVVSFFGNFSYAGDTGEFSLLANVTNTNDPGLIAPSDPILFTSIWDGTSFTDAKLSLPGNTVLLGGILNAIPDDWGKTVYIDGNYTISSGLWDTKFSTIIDFSSTLTLGESFTDMDTDFSGTMTASLESRALPTPVPASLTLLGFGLVAIVGFRRKNYTLSR